MKLSIYKADQGERIFREMNNRISIAKYGEIIAFATAGKTALCNKISYVYDVDAFLQVMYGWDLLQKVHSELGDDYYSRLVSAGISMFLSSCPRNNILLTFTDPCRRFVSDGVQRLIVIPTTDRYIEGWSQRQDESKPHPEADLIKSASKIREWAFRSPYPVIELDKGEYLSDIFLGINSEAHPSKDMSGRADSVGPYTRNARVWSNDCIPVDFGQVNRGKLRYIEVKGGKHE